MLSEQTLIRNLAALDEAQGARPRFAALDPATTRAVPHDGGLLIEVRGRESWVPLWGADPVSEADVQLQATDGARHLFLIGAGVGHVLDALEHARKSTKVVVLEPDPGIAVLFLARRDWQPWIADGRLRLLTGPDYVGATSCAKYVDGAQPTAILVNEVMATHRPEAVDRARAVARNIQEGAAANAEARRKFAGRYLLQTLGNLPVIAREGNAAALDGAFSGRPAVIVAAGPSLDRAVSTLAPFQDRVAIIAADTTLRPLLAGGVRPHIVIGLDPADLNAKHLSGVPDTSGIWLAGEGSLHPSAFVDFGGRMFTFQVSNHQPWPWLAGAGLRRGQLRAWGSVATSALDLALRMGCDPVIFTGHDLAYTNNRPYCDNTVFHEEWRAYLANNPGTIQHYEELMMQGRPLVTTTDINGAAVHTTPHLMAFRDWIVEQTTVTTNRRFINGTGAGILRGPRIVQMPMDTALCTHAVAAFPIREVLAECHARSTSVANAGPARLDPPSDAVIEGWIAFSAGTVTRDQILSTLRSAFSRTTPSPPWA